MTQNEHQTTANRDDILMEFALGDRELLTERLAEFIAAYPEFGASLAHLAQEIEDFEKAPLSELSASEAYEQQFALQIALEGMEVSGTSDPFEAANPQQLRGLAAHLQANSVFITRLKDRVIDVGDMTDGFIASVASFFSSPVERVRASLGKNHRIAAGTAFKSKGKPEAVHKQSFDEAVRSSGLTPQQQDHLRSL